MDIFEAPPAHEQMLFSPEASFEWETQHASHFSPENPEARQNPEADRFLGGIMKRIGGLARRGSPRDLPIARGHDPRCRPDRQSGARLGCG